MQARLEIHVAAEDATLEIAGQHVPLEVEPSATLAYSLTESALWETELAAFFRGDLLCDRPTNLGALQPYRPGRFPLVLVHGTASSSARWADMVNQLANDPRIGDRFQFWFFTYETGNPIPASALQLRDALSDAVAELDPDEADAALRRMVIVGHSQGGLLATLAVVETGTGLWDAVSSRPLDELELGAETRELLRRTLFVAPLPFVDRVVFIATPHRGSDLAALSLGRFVASLVRLPFDLLSAARDLVAANPDALRLDPSQARLDSIYGMTPGRPILTAWAEMPAAPGVRAHSIIAVRGDGPVETGSDGVVSFQSARLEGIESELVVRSGHSSQSHPHTIEEVRRILLLHLDEHCDLVHACAPAPASTAELG